MKKGQISTILLILALIGGGINLYYRYYWLPRSQRPAFEVFDVRAFNDLEPMTIVHYQIRNVGGSTAHEVLTSVAPVDGNASLPAYFQNISVGEAVSVNRRIPLGQYTKLKIGIICLEFQKAKYYTVEPDVKPEPPPSPDFLVYNLSIITVGEGNQTSNRAVFWIMNIGGSTAHRVNVFLAEGGYTVIPTLSVGIPMRLIIDLRSLPQVVDVEVSCEEGVRQTYFLREYG